MEIERRLSCYVNDISNPYWQKLRTVLTWIIFNSDHSIILALFGSNLFAVFLTASPPPQTHTHILSFKNSGIILN